MNYPFVFAPAEGNKKKSLYKTADTRMWRDPADPIAVAYDPAIQNGVPAPHMLPLTNYSRHYGQAVQGYAVPGAQWLPQYLMPHVPQVEEGGYMAREGGYGREGYMSRERGVVMMPAAAEQVPFNPMIPQITTHMSALQLGTAGSVSINQMVEDSSLFFYKRINSCHVIFSYI